MKAPAQVKPLGTNWGPNSFDPEFWSKIEFGTPFNPFVFFLCPVLSFIPCFSQTGGSRALFRQLDKSNMLPTYIIPGLSCTRVQDAERNPHCGQCDGIAIALISRKV